MCVIVFEKYRIVYYLSDRGQKCLNQKILPNTGTFFVRTLEHVIEFEVAKFSRYVTLLIVAVVHVPNSRRS